MTVAAVATVRDIDRFGGLVVRGAPAGDDLERLRDRRIAVVGDGVRLAPPLRSLVRTAASATVFHGTPAWVLPRLAAAGRSRSPRAPRSFDATCAIRGSGGS